MDRRRLVVTVFIASLIMVTACSGGGPQYPFDTGYSDSADLAQEYAEGREFVEQYDEYLDSKYDEYGETSLEMTQEAHGRELDAMADEEQGYASSSGGDCPNGCTTHKSGCDIKGNISFDKGERIYHVPGQNFYSETIINPDKGERWFCTEEEARANRWRKAQN